MKEALFYQSMAEGRVHCTLCPHDCKIGTEKHGACGVRFNHEGILYTLVYDKVIARNVDPIEKKPFFHFQPGSASYSIATVGCSLRCKFCQNWEISQMPKGRPPLEEKREASEPICPLLEAAAHRIPGERVTPRQIVNAALQTGAKSIAYTYTEPTIFYELAYDTAILARAKGLKNLFVTSGFISEMPLRQMATVLDAANVDLKFFKDENYKRITGARLRPVLEAIRLYRTLGVWVEVTTLVIPGLNDSVEGLRQIAQFVHSVGPEIPWHVNQFYPAYRMTDRGPTPISTLRRARQIGFDAGLRYVYEGNVPGEGGENTYCYGCKSLLIDRYGFLVLENRIRHGKCPDCRASIDGVEMDGPREDCHAAPTASDTP
ncbi:MAG: AmmeMemoRadiSam system radical SAM enzyme [Candidatus Methylomirabilales bacterium]